MTGIQIFRGFKVHDLITCESKFQVVVSLPLQGSTLITLSFLIAGGEPTTCRENVSFPVLKLKIAELEKALNLTGSHIKDLRTEPLNMQKVVIAYLTIRVKEI